MENTTQCPCSSGQRYEHCCAPFHGGTLPNNAEQLMRSRYSAYALCLPDYLIQTTHPSQRKTIDREELIDWSKSNQWVRLELLKSSSSMVEFKAYFINPAGVAQIHHELSTFTFDKGKWYYVKGSFY